MDGKGKGKEEGNVPSCACDIADRLFLNSGVDGWGEDERTAGEG